jgi:thioredoxin-dependent peroxiredoxin
MDCYLTTSDGTRTSLGELYQQGRFTLVYFFPIAGCSRNCQRQALSIKQAYPALRRKRVNVIGIGGGSQEDQRAFRAELDLPYELAASNREVMDLFGVDGVVGSEVPRRQSFILFEGEVFWSDRAASTSNHGAVVLRAIEELEAQIATANIPQ